MLENSFGQRNKTLLKRKQLPLQPSNTLASNNHNPVIDQNTKNAELLGFNLTGERKRALDNSVELNTNVHDDDSVELKSTISHGDDYVDLIQKMDIYEDGHNNSPSDKDMVNPLSIYEDVNCEYEEDPIQEDSSNDSAKIFGSNSNFKKIHIPDEWIAHVVNEKDSNLVSVFYSDSEVSSSSSEYNNNNNNGTGLVTSDITDLFKKKKSQKTFSDIDAQINLDSFIGNIEKTITEDSLDKMAQEELNKQEYIAKITDSTSKSSNGKPTKYFFLNINSRSETNSDDNIPSELDDSIEVDLAKDKLPTVKDMAILYNRALKE